MHPTFGGMIQYAVGKMPQASTAAIALMLFALFSALRFSEALLSIKGGLRQLWMMPAAGTIGYCCFAAQVVLLQLLGISSDGSYDASLLLLALLLCCAGWFVALEGITTRHASLRRFILCGTFDASAALATQIALFRSAHVWYMLSGTSIFSAVFLCIVGSISAQTISYWLLRQMEGSPRMVRVFLLAAGTLVLFTLRYVVFFVVLWNGRPRPSPPLFRQALQIPQVAMDLVPLFAVVLLFLAQVSLHLYWRGLVWSRSLEEAERRQEVTKAMSEQRATRLENDALLEEIRERKSAEERLAASAFLDPVTGLHNRVYLRECLETYMQRNGNRTHGIGALLYIDLDNFKSVNDMLGHTQGDRVLVKLAQRWRSCMRESDVIARIGGDEFAVLMRSAKDVDATLRLAQRLLAVAESPVENAGHTFYLSASIGLCPVDTFETDSQMIVRNADLAMYRAKREGGNQVKIFAPEMYTETIQAMQDRAELKRAIQEEEFVLWYQPLVDMSDGTVHGMEALIRWQHPTKGLVGPYGFIPLAEETGHILEIGNWVLRKACGDFPRFQEASRTHLLLSLNVSTRQLELPSFLDLLKSVLRETGMPPTQLQLEITESVLLGEPLRMGALFHQVRSLGVKIAFDDFGTGYSSLSYIQRFPVDTLKIDQSFVRSLRPGSVNENIIRLMLDLSRTVGMGVSAEGVETEQEASALLQLNCRIAQGFLYSKPVAPELFTSLLGKGSLITESVPEDVLLNHG